MTRAEVKQCAEIMMEYANGKTVQCAVKTVPNEWKDITDDDSPVFNFAICNYRIKPEVKEPTYRPYKDCDEMIADIDERFRGCRTTYCTMPSIWIRSKATGKRYLITCFDSNSFNTSNNYTMEEALKYFVYLDGSPVGKLED